MRRKGLSELVDRRMYTWSHTAHGHLRNVDMGPTGLQERMQRAKMTVAHVPVPGLPFAELRENRDFQHKHFLHIKTHNEAGLGLSTVTS